MNRRTFIVRSSGLLLTAWVGPAIAQPAPTKDKLDRIAMGTLLFRYRFKQTRPREMASIKDELTLFDIPQHHRDRFGIRNIEFWSNHLESIEMPYLGKVKEKIQAAKSRLLNVQFDFPYDLASANEAERLESVKTVKRWMDAASYLGSACVRVNPGRAKGSVEKSIDSFREISGYAKSKNLVVITANHFGLEMNPDLHVRVVKEAGADNLFTEPDFGNYSEKQRLASLEKILPNAYIVSAKVDEFNDKMEHVSYDFDQCVQLCERLGFKGVYMVSQYSSKFQDIDYEKVGDWVIEHLRRNIA